MKADEQTVVRIEVIKPSGDVTVHDQILEQYVLPLKSQTAVEILRLVRDEVRQTA